MTANAQIGAVLSGGGANGAYEVGVMKALLNGASPATDYRPIDPRIYTGTSTGAYNAAIMASQPGTPAPAAVAHLERLWLDEIANTPRRCGNGVYRIRGVSEVTDPGCWAQPFRTLLELGGDAALLGTFGLVKGAEFLGSDSSLSVRFLSLVDLGAFVSETPLTRLLASTVSVADLKRSNKVLDVAATNWRDGDLRIFSRREIVYQVGTEAILASSAIPGIFPPVEIDGVPFVDGSVVLNTPVRPAIRAGAREVHIVFVDPLLEGIQFNPIPSSIDVFYRLLAILGAVQIRHDVERAAAINRTLKLIETGILSEAAAASPSDRKLLGDFLAWGHEFIRRRLSGRPYRRLTIHIYRPKIDLGGGEGLLNFDRDRLAKLIELGHQDAVEHDCAQAGCLVVGGAGR